MTLELVEVVVAGVMAVMQANVSESSLSSYSEIK
jgi:hypothetical protein